MNSKPYQYRNWSPRLFTLIYYHNISNGSIEKNIVKTIIATGIFARLNGEKENQTKGEKAVLDAIQGGYKNWKEFDIDTIQLLLGLAKRLKS